MNRLACEQTRLGSLVEAWVSVLIGFAINFTANMLILPLFGFVSLTLGTNLVIGVIYTAISVVRSYVIRRWFNAKLRGLTEQIARGIES